MKKVLRYLPGILITLGIAIVLFSAGSDDYSLMHGEGADENAFMNALSGMALVLIGTFIARIRRYVR